MRKPPRHHTDISDRQVLDLLHQSVADVRRVANRSLQMIIDTEEALKLASKMDSPLLMQPRGGRTLSFTIGRRTWRPLIFGTLSRPSRPPGSFGAARLHISSPLFELRAVPFGLRYSPPTTPDRPQHDLAAPAIPVRRAPRRGIVSSSTQFGRSVRHNRQQQQSRRWRPRD